MQSVEVRETFLKFFEERGHRRLPSSPLVLPNDPTLLFANAGMNQFKDTFTGKEPRDFNRAATSQKCLRVSGKHNDLEMVGRTPRHHTFFEMLGNFSFGDYFKRDAIEFAWSLITDVYGLPADRLWVTVFEGDAEFPADDEAADLWRVTVGVEPSRILRLPAAENFWRMGDSGPCGPCTEIHFDLGEDLRSVSGASTPETDDQRFLEIWNLVFMQFDQQADGAKPLPKPSIDTGMGLERISSVLQGHRSNYDTDLFQPLVQAAAVRAGQKYGSDPEADFSMRVIADHVRAFCFLIADGVTPANDKRGYVLRRLLRRAIRHGRKLGMQGPFLHEVTPVLIEQFSSIFPELAAARDAILDVGRREETRFADTLSTGIQLLDDSIAKLKPSASGRSILPGQDLFLLYDTFGFPLDLARDIAEEKGVELDEVGFEQAMAHQRQRAQASWKQEKQAESSEQFSPWIDSKFSSEFKGYDQTQLDDVRILSLLSMGEPTETLAPGAEGELLLEATPFYAESGGQVGDTGWIVGPNGQAQVLDTQKPAAGLIAHRVRVENGSLTRGDRVHAEVDGGRRNAIRRNHTATHLIHAALRDVVGTHVKQAGSRVAPDRLRFDFSHFAPVSEDAIAEIETLVNREVLKNTPVQTDIADIEDALKLGAMALFGEKYGDRVRVVQIGDFSLELCGGTHTGRTGEIGLIKLVQERGVASGTRRVEAISGEASLDSFRSDHGLVRAFESHLSVPRDQLVGEVDRRLEQLRQLQKQLEMQKLGAVRGDLLERASKAPEVLGVKVFAARVDSLGSQETRELADNLRQKLGSGVVVLGRADGSKAGLLVAVTKDLMGKLPAGELVKSLARVIGGGGGGRSDLAEAGGKDPSKLDEALGLATEEVRRRMEA